MSEHARSAYLKGAMYAIAAIAIWASWSALTRLAVTTDLDAWDIALLRIGIPGILLIPVILKHGLGIDRLGWHGLALLIVSGGVPYVLLASHGLRFAPAHHQAALNPGCMPLFVALITTTLLGDKLTRPRQLGLVLIFIGALMILGLNDTSWSNSLLFGHTLFLAASLLWAIFTVMLRHGQLNPLHAIALVSTGSTLIFFPFYLIIAETHVLQMPLIDFAIQAIYQGVLVTVVSLILYARAINLLGPSSAGAFGALVPVLSTLLAIVIIHEWPSGSDWLAMLLISIGVYLTSGGPLPEWLQRRTSKT